MKLTLRFLQKFQVIPKRSLVDENITISTKTPNTKVKLSLSLTNNHDLDYFSSQTLTTDEKGQICGQNALSLFWHLKPTNHKAQRFWTNDVTKPHVCNFQWKTTEKCYSETITRHIMDSGVTRIPVEFGTLFMPKGPGPFPAVISMYGGVHRGQVVEERSALLASRGFASLALPYFGVGNLPKTYLELDLDYFEKAVDFLWTFENIKIDKGIGAIGISKSAEIALLMGTYFNDKVTAVVAMNGLPMLTGKYTYKGTSVLKEWKFYEENHHKIQARQDKLIDFSRLFDKAENQYESFIPFSNSQAKFFFLFGQDDKCSPPEVPLKLISQSKANYELLPGVGHLIELPNSPPVPVSNHVLFPKSQVMMGGNDIHLHSIGQIEAWKKILKFFSVLI